MDNNENLVNCRFVLAVMKTKQDLRFQALRLIHYIIYRVICDDKDLQTFGGACRGDPYLPRCISSQNAQRLPRRNVFQ